MIQHAHHRFVVNSSKNTYRSTQPSCYSATNLVGRALSARSKRVLLIPAVALPHKKYCMNTNTCTCSASNRLLTVNEVSAMLGIKPHTLHTWRSLGEETPLPVQEREEVRDVSDEHVARIFSGLAEYRTTGLFYGPPTNGQFKDMVIVMFGCGLRIGELLGIRVGDINLDSTPPTLSVNGTVINVKGMGPVYQPRPKTKSSKRTLPISQDVVDAIKRRLEKRQNLQPADFLFVTDNQTLISESNFQKQWRGFLAYVGLSEEKINTHRIRKTFATRIEKSVGIHSTSKLLGHSDILTTIRSYIAQPDVVNLGMSDAIQSMYSIESVLLDGRSSADSNGGDDYVI